MADKFEDGFFDDIDEPVDLKDLGFDIENESEEDNKDNKDDKDDKESGKKSNKEDDKSELDTDNNESEDEKADKGNDKGNDKVSKKESKEENLDEDDEDNEDDEGNEDNKLNKEEKEELENKKSSKPKTVPYSRLNEVVEERNQYREMLAKMQAEIDSIKNAKNVEPEIDIDLKEEEAVNALLEGDTKKAAAIRKEINNELKRQATLEAQNKIQKDFEQRELTSSINRAVEETVGKYPELDTNGAFLDKELLKETLEWRDFYINQGKRPDLAIKMAADKVMTPIYKEKEAKEEVENKKVVKNTSERNKDAIKKAAETSNKQPPSPNSAGIGNRATAGSTDYSKMSQKEWDKLPEKERIKLLMG